MRKNGQGKANWGTYKDDNKEEVAETKEEVVEEEEVDDSVTLSELLKARQQRATVATA
jgi:hypothetical protein